MMFSDLLFSDLRPVVADSVEMNYYPQIDYRCRNACSSRRKPLELTKGGQKKLEQPIWQTQLRRSLRILLVEP